MTLSDVEEVFGRCNLTSLAVSSIGWMRPKKFEDVLDARNAFPVSLSFVGGVSAKDFEVLDMRSASPLDFEGEFDLRSASTLSAFAVDRTLPSDVEEVLDVCRSRFLATSSNTMLLWDVEELCDIGTASALSTCSVIGSTLCVVPDS